MLFRSRQFFRAGAITCASAAAIAAVGVGRRRPGRRPLQPLRREARPAQRRWLRRARPLPAVTSPASSDPFFTASVSWLPQPAADKSITAVSRIPVHLFFISVFPPVLFTACPDVFLKYSLLFSSNCISLFPSFYLDFLVTYKLPGGILSLCLRNFLHKRLHKKDLNVFSPFRSFLVICLCISLRFFSKQAP